MTAVTLQDYAAPFRRVATGRATPDDLDAYQRARLAAKRAAALAVLGARYVLHPNYDHAANTHHSPGYRKAATLGALAATARAQGRIE